MYWFLCSPDQLQLLNASYVGFFLLLRCKILVMLSVRDGLEWSSPYRVNLNLMPNTEPACKSWDCQEVCAQYTLHYTTLTFFFFSLLYLYIYIYHCTFGLGLLVFQILPIVFCFCSEILCEVQSWVCARLPPWYHQLPRLKVLW